MARDASIARMEDIEAYYRRYLEINVRNKALDPHERIDALRAWFVEKTGETLELDTPITFNQKIQWLKIHDSTPLKGRLADKYRVRAYVADTLGGEYLVPLLGVYDSPNNVDLTKLPDCFVLKATHGSNWNIIVDDKRRFDWVEAQSLLSKWLELDYGFMRGMEVHYHYCEPKIIAEEFLAEPEGEMLVDYRVYVFNAGSPVIAASRGREVAFYDAAWNRLSISRVGFSSFDCPKPKKLRDMLELSEALASPFAMVRVDWYEVGGRLYFGEMTFTPGNGLNLFNPEEWNHEFGSRIDLSSVLPVADWSRCR